MTEQNLTISSVRARPVLVPFRRPVHTASFMIPKVPLVLIDIQISDGTVGRAYLLGYMDWVLKPIVDSIDAMAGIIVGEALAPQHLTAMIRKKTILIGATGITGLAVGGIDMALWDARARADGVPLATLLGGAPRHIRAYNSCGLWLKSPDTLGEEAAELIAEGNFDAVKIRIGRPDPAADLQAIRNVRAAIGPDRHLMSDYNMSQRTGSAIERGRMIDDEGLYWIEDPLRHEDYEGHARVRAALETPIQTGENMSDAQKLQRAYRMGAMDFVMPDVGMIGGVTGWLQAAAVSDVDDIPMSSHLYPEFSRHLLAVTPTAHWLEFVDWASPVIAEPAAVENGQIIAPERPGAGIEWDEEAVAKYSI